MSNKQRDLELLKSAAAGDMVACRTLVDENLKPMLGLAYHMLGDVTEAEDVAQDAFLKLWKQAPKWRPEATAKVWLYRVVHNLCIDRLRKDKRLVDFEAPEEAADPDQIDEIHNGEVTAALNAAVMSLPVRQRTAIALVHLEDQSNIAAADIMGISVEALESLLARGKRGLRDKLKGRQKDLLGGLEW